MKIIPKRVAGLLWVFALCFSSGLHAQIRIAAYGGIQSAKVIESNHIPGWDTATGKYYSPRTGFHLGIMAEIPIGSGFYFQPGLGYSSKGRKYEKLFDTLSGPQDTIYDQRVLKLGYIEIPLLLTYKLPLSTNRKNYFFLSAGPAFSFFYNGSFSEQSQTLVYNSNTYQFNSDAENVSVGNGVNKYKTFDFGINAKAGLELGNLMLSVYFSRGLSSFYTAPYEGSFKHSLVGGTLGIWLGKPVAAEPRTKKDSDHDGIPDEEDACPHTAGTRAWHGCPVPDTDGDGIDDEHDSCKTVPGVARYKGCPVPDTDGDGIDDEHDSCKTVPGLARYNGCPVPDTDGDGIDDEHDSCKTIPGVEKYHGCPMPDRDHDGIADEDDKCPDMPGTAANNGCPELPPQADSLQIPSIPIQILFESSKSVLTKESAFSLSTMADQLKIHPGWKVIIEGYADASGNPSKNRLLSGLRAQAVKNALVQLGVSGKRIQILAFGDQNPIAGNNTPEGKAANRRVEIKWTK